MVSCLICGTIVDAADVSYNQALENRGAHVRPGLHANNNAKISELALSGEANR